jgi:hypothetical protein
LVEHIWVKSFAMMMVMFWFVCCCQSANFYCKPTKVECWNLFHDKPDHCSQQGQTSHAARVQHPLQVWLLIFLLSCALSLLYRKR